MKIILPEFENLIFVNDSAYGENKAIRRIAKVKIKGLSHPVPLKSLGGYGMLRILQLILKIFPAKGGFFLMDEFGNGLHYSVQEKIWALLFDVAQKLDIQVFATTHSWDCIEGFQNAVAKEGFDDGLVVRLEKHGDEVTSTLFDARRLSIATNELIEIR